MSAVLLNRVRDKSVHFLTPELNLAVPCVLQQARVRVLCYSRDPALIEFIL